MRRAVASANCLAILLCSLAPPASAQALSPDASAPATETAAPESVARPDKARSPAVRAAELRLSAVARAREGAFDAAAELFRASHELEPSPRTLLGWAAADEGAGRRIAAYRRYEQVAEDTRSEAALIDLRRAAERRLSALRRILAQLQLRAPKGAEFWIDGRKISASQTRLPQLLEPGKHRVWYQLPSQAARRKTLELVLKAGEIRYVVVEQSQAPAPTRLPARDSVTPTSAPRWTAIGLGAVGIGALATGAGFFAAAVTTQQSLSVGCRPDCADDVDQAKHHEIVGYSAMAGGLVLTAVATVLLLWPNPVSPPGPKLSAAREFQLTLGPNGLRFRGSF